MKPNISNISAGGKLFNASRSMKIDLIPRDASIEYRDNDHSPTYRVTTQAGVPDFLVDHSIDEGLNRSTQNNNSSLFAVARQSMNVVVAKPEKIVVAK
jgi:hypothetical protein